MTLLPRYKVGTGQCGFGKRGTIALAVRGEETEQEEQEGNGEWKLDEDG